MMMVLEEAGWKCSKIAPFNDLGWIHAVWIDEVKKALEKS